MRLHKSAGFVIGAILVLVAIWGFRWVWPRIQLEGYHPQPVVPTDIDLVAILPGAGYRIIVSNGIAHLVEAQQELDENGKPKSASFEATESALSGTDESGRLPMRETLKALGGDPVALGKLVMQVNKIRDEDLPTVERLWTAEEIKRALDGDQGLRSRLEHDLNTKLDGTPLPTLDLNSILNGIVVEAPLTVNVPIEGQLRPIECRIRQPYKTLFAGSIEAIVNERFNLSKEALIGFYRTTANKVIEGGRREDVAASLMSRIDPKVLQQKAVAPEKILANTHVLINDTHITGASFVPYEGPNRSILSDVTLKLTEDGRMRLWKYSHENPGFQLLLTVDGIAIAAPRIKTELAENQVKLTRVPSKEMVQDAVDAINRRAAGQKEK